MPTLQRRESETQRSQGTSNSYNHHMAKPEVFSLMQSYPLPHDPSTVSSDSRRWTGRQCTWCGGEDHRPLLKQKPKFRSGAYSLDRVDFPLKAVDILRYKHQDVRDDLREVWDSEERSSFMPGGSLRCERGISPAKGLAPWGASVGWAGPRHRVSYLAFRGRVVTQSELEKLQASLGP